MPLGTVATLINIWWVQKFKVTKKNLLGILCLNGSYLTREGPSEELPPQQVWLPATTVSVIPLLEKCVWGHPSASRSSRGSRTSAAFREKESVFFFLLSVFSRRGFWSPIQGNQTLSYRNSNLRLLLLPVVISAACCVSLTFGRILEV